MTARAHDRAQGSPLRQRMIEQMRIANLAESTQYSYLFEIERLAGHYTASPADLDADQLRAWVLTLIDRGLSPATTNATLSALRFLYVETLGCPDRVAGLRNRKKPHMLPRHMTEQEVERLILATPDHSGRQKPLPIRYGCAGIRKRIRVPPAIMIRALTCRMVSHWRLAPNAATIVECSNIPAVSVWSGP